MKSFLKRHLGPSSVQKLQSLRRRALRLGETLIWGSPLRERFLVALLAGYYESLFRRLWVLGEEPPHFANHRIDVFGLGFGPRAVGPQPFYRGFFSSEVVRRGDRLLDIGCGDGFFTMRFFGDRCSRIDAIDVEPDAIRTAGSQNASPNIRYFLLDAVSQPFPDSQYDVVVWDGALGHFPPDTTHQILAKILRVLAPEGIFVGSESLGHEGEDHLQFFESLEELGGLFKPYWKHIQLRSVSYPINKGALMRREAYWRCCSDPKRLQEAGWKTF